ncbi:MAG: hypothetical protein KAG92_02910 [Deltaproteobacteria bacterium]|nr:hypothetical protein [Deltaproteobacteria bacterium]
MNRQEIIALKLSPALKECRQHRRRLHVAWEEAVTFPPLEEDSTEELSDEQVRTLDQLLYRFGKLQDAIGTRLLPAMLQLVQEWQDNEPFLDKLNRAEKLRMLPSVEQWQLLRELRNQTTHEYPAQPEIVRGNLRRLIAHVPVLEEACTQLVTWAELHIR